jgi:GAF domain-containing protein
VACTRIKKGRGVCGTSWDQSKTIVVPNVQQFAGHIACSSRSRSEIVVPVFSAGKVVAVLDVDSDELDQFDYLDQLYLEQIVSSITFPV